MNPVEDEAIRRIDLRRALAELPKREKAILRDCCRYGWTLAEAGARFGITGARANQLYHKAAARLRARLRPHKTDDARPSIVARSGFDRAAFLRHMRRLIELREQRETLEFEKDRAAIAGLVERERARKRTYTKHIPEQIYEPPKQLPASQLEWTATAALVALMNMLRPSEPGTPETGEFCTVCTFDGWTGSTEHAVSSMVQQMPGNVRLSVHETPLPEGYRGAIASNEYACVRVICVDFNRLRLDVTWDRVDV